MKRILLFILALIALTAPVWAQTTYTNLPISCARANGLQADVAACTDTEQRQQPAQADDVVLACTKATPCGWYDAELTWRKWSSVPDTATVVVCPLNAAPGLMNCPGATSPTWGGLTAVTKAQVTVAAPPPVGTVAYVVTWTNATKNTDGTPVSTPVRVKIQASPTQDFASIYEWTGSAGAENLSVPAAPSGVLYWRTATLDAQNRQSDWTSPLVRTEKQFKIDTFPSCLPWPIDDAAVATRPYFELGLKGGSVYWACKLPDGTWKDAGTWGLYKKDCIDETTAAVAGDGANLRAAMKTMWGRCIDISNPADAPYKPGYDALAATYRPAPAAPPSTTPKFVVKPNAGYATRPAYAIVNGSRTSTVAGRVNIKDAGGVPVACDCTAFSGGTEPNRYCAVTGQENVATATVGDKLGPSAAVCTAVP